MLINRTIAKPNEKIELLTTYLEKNKILDDFYQLKITNDIIQINRYFIEEKKLCEILHISKNTLRQWNENMNGSLVYSIRNYLIGAESVSFFLDSKRKLAYWSEIDRSRYYIIFNLFHFLVQNSRRQKYIKKS
jgi:hypothetical protein